MKIAIIGTTTYKNDMLLHKEVLEAEGHEVRMPFFDDAKLDELGICVKNREMIEWADEVHIFWNQRSMGTIFDFGMCFALGKPIALIYIEEKTFRGVMEKYQAVCKQTTVHYRGNAAMCRRSSF